MSWCKGWHHTWDAWEEGVGIRGIHRSHLIFLVAIVSQVQRAGMVNRQSWNFNSCEVFGASGKGYGERREPEPERISKWSCNWHGYDRHLAARILKFQFFSSLLVGAKSGNSWSRDLRCWVVGEDHQEQSQLHVASSIHVRQSEKGISKGWREALQAQLFEAVYLQVCVSFDTLGMWS